MTSHSHHKGLFCVLFLWLAAEAPRDVTGTAAYLSAYLKRTNSSSLIKDSTTLPGSSTEQFGPPFLKDIDEKYSRLTSVKLTNCYLRRIYHMNPILKAVLEVNLHAIKEAYNADKERRSGKIRSPMHGIPMLIKDHISVRDHLATSAGSWALFGMHPKKDADVVTALRQAGVVILGKSNLSELSGFRGMSKSGWSGRGGQTRNAYLLTANTHGSSSGSAVGVSANMAVVSIGGETDGSLIAPASVAGICTLKPTLGKISTAGLIPISHNQDCVGPMARNMVDLAILFDAMFPPDSEPVGTCDGTYTECVLDKKYFKKFRIGILRQPFWDPDFIILPELKSQLLHLEELLEKMQEMTSFFEIQDPVFSPLNVLVQISSEKELTVLLHDFKHEMNEYLRNNVVNHVSNVMSSRRISTLRDIIKYNIDHPDGETQGLLVMAEATDGIHNKTYLQAKRSNQAATREMLSSVLEMYELDAILFPNPLPTSVAGGYHPVTLDENLEDVPLFGFTHAAIAGYPSVNVPAGMDSDGVPFGVTLVGAPNSEATLLQIGVLMEALNPARKKPQFLV